MTNLNPHPGFDRSKVKGMVITLFTIKPNMLAYSSALEVAAGGKLFEVVVDTDETGKLLLNNCCFGNALQLIPLNTIHISGIRTWV